jgi:hypothetical protein
LVATLAAHDVGSRALLGEAVGCLALCCDEIQEGIAASNSGLSPATGDPLTMRT